MNTAYLAFFPLAILLTLMAFVFFQNPKGRINRLFAIYMFVLAVATQATLVIATTTSPALAEAAVTTLLVAIWALNSFFLLTIVLGLYFRRHVTRWYGLPLLLGISLVFSVAVVADVATDRGLFFTIPAEMGHGYVSISQHLRGSLAPLLRGWFFGGILVSLGLLVIVWWRSQPGERAPIGWLIVSLLLSGSVSSLLPAHPLNATLNPMIFSVTFAIVVGPYRLLMPTRVSVGAVVRGSSEGMIICDQDGVVEQINPAAENLTGVSEERAVGHPFSQAFAPLLQQSGPEETPLTQAATSGFTESFETVLRLQEPDRRILTIDGVPIRDQRGRVAGTLISLRDVTERERAREALEAQARLAETVRELSTPIVPVTEGVLILPLVGAIDSERAQNIISDLLNAIRAHRARVILIDITGVPVVDTLVANHLLQAMQAARLLGCQGVLVGIRAEVARTLVNLGMNLSGLVTKGSLQDGLEYAMSNVSKSRESVPSKRP